MNPLIVLALIGLAPFVLAALLMTSASARKVFVWFALALLLGVFMWPFALGFLLYH